jgi:hypothetical protein
MGLMTDVDWGYTCDADTFEVCRHDEKFRFLMALARCLNAMTFIQGTGFEEGDAPKNQRDDMNKYFFLLAILYEGLDLVDKMHQAFKDDQTFQNGLGTVSKGATATRIKKNQLKPLRRGAVFHFDPKVFAPKEKTFESNCTFISARGTEHSDVWYEFADTVTAMMLSGSVTTLEEFSANFGRVFEETAKLADSFFDGAAVLIRANLEAWGFKRTESKSIVPA